MSKQHGISTSPAEWLMVELDKWLERHPGASVGEAPESLLEAFAQHFERVDRETQQLEAAQRRNEEARRGREATQAAADRNAPPPQPFEMPRPRGWRTPELAAAEAEERARIRAEDEARHRARREAQLEAAAKGRVKLQPGELRRKIIGGCNVNLPKEPDDE